MQKTGRLLVAEDSAAAGGVGQRIAAGLFDAGIQVRGLALANTGHAFVTHGTCRNETAALFHSDPGSASSLPGSFGKKRPGYPEIYQEEYEESPEETGNVPERKAETGSNVNNK